MSWLVLFAQVAKREDPFRRPEVIWGTAAIAVALLFGAFAIWFVDRWRKKASQSDRTIGELTDFRGMYERGEITEEEYNRLREKVAKRVKQPTPSRVDGEAVAQNGVTKTPPPAAGTGGVPGPTV